MLSGLGRGAATGAAYGLAVVLVYAAIDPPLDQGVGGLLLAVVILGTWAAAFGALYALGPGCVGGLVLGLFAEAGWPRRPLVAAGAAIGAVMGFFEFDAYGVLVDAPHLNGAADLLLWRVGPGAAGALGAAWQGARTRVRVGDSS